MIELAKLYCTGKLPISDLKDKKFELLKDVVSSSAMASVSCDTPEVGFQPKDAPSEPDHLFASDRLPRVVLAVRNIVLHVRACLLRLALRKQRMEFAFATE